MKKFDWNGDVKNHREETQSYLRKVQGSGISEQIFIKEYTTLPGGRRPLSEAKDQYKKLSEKFNFFN